MSSPEESGLHEERTRVICHLPLNNGAEEKAINQLIGYLERQRTEPIGVKGFTRSALRPATYRGHWWSATHRKWFRESIVLFIIDYKLPFEGEKVSEKVAELKGFIRKAYEKFTKKPQEEVWIVAQPVLRHEG